MGAYNRDGNSWLSAAAAMGGGDEDDYDKVDDYTKERNLLIKNGDGWLKIPVPYGHGFSTT